jgi:hypothetical protein
MGGREHCLHLRATKNDSRAMHACMPETGNVRQSFMATSLCAAILPLNLIAAWSVDTLAVAAFGVTHVHNDVYVGQSWIHGVTKGQLCIIASAIHACEVSKLCSALHNQPCTVSHVPLGTVHSRTSHCTSLCPYTPDRNHQKVKNTLSTTLFDN